ncbi:MAG: exosortase system-associated protein, TIGR04073 family [Verrucomicrobiota bacterium]
MKKFLAVLVLASVGSLGIADIHEPPKTKYTKARKLSRGVSNILYGWSEIPATMYRWGELHTEQSAGIFYGGFIQGFQRAGARMKFGIYEVINFQRPLYKDSYRPVMPDIDYLPWRGYEEFPPQIGYLSTVGYTRRTSW